MINLIAKFVEIGNSEVGEIAWTYLCYEVQIEICNADLIDDKWREERNIHNMISDELGFDTYNLFLIKTGSEYYLLRTLISDNVYIDDSADDVYEIIENEEEEDEIILKSNVSIDDALEWLKTLTVITISDVEKNEKLNKYYWDGSSEELMELNTEREWINNSTQKSQLIEYEKFIHKFLEKMSDPRIAPWFDILQIRGDSQFRASQNMGVKMDDYDYWADGHYQEYVLRIELDDNDPMKLNHEELKFRVCVFSEIKGYIQKVIDKAIELSLNITQETSNDWHAVQASILGAQKALLDLGMKVECYENGQIKGEYQLKNGRCHGFYKVYHKNGQLLVESKFNEGLQADGEVVSYHDNGGKARVINLVNQIKQGEYREWYPDGKLKTIGHYKDGKATIKESF